MLRLLARCVLMAAIGTLIFASTVSAAKPTREFLALPDDFVLAGGQGICDFDVNLHVDANREYATAWTNADGSLRMVVITGSLKITLTNLDSGASMALNIPGPSHTRFDADGNPTRNVAVGPWLIWGIGEPGLWFYRGQLDFETLNFNGNVVDLCAGLSA